MQLPGPLHMEFHLAAVRCELHKLHGELSGAQSHNRDSRSVHVPMRSTVQLGREHALLPARLQLHRQCGPGCLLPELRGPLSLRIRVQLGSQHHSLRANLPITVLFGPGDRRLSDKLLADQWHAGVEHDLHHRPMLMSPRAGLERPETLLLPVPDDPGCERDRESPSKRVHM